MTDDIETVSPDPNPEDSDGDPADIAIDPATDGPEPAQAGETDPSAEPASGTEP